jgi:hypothetical protein
MYEMSQDAWEETWFLLHSQIQISKYGDKISLSEKKRRAKQQISDVKMKIIAYISTLSM